MPKFTVKSTTGNRGYRQWFIEDEYGEAYVSYDAFGNETIYFSSQKEAEEVCEDLNS